MANDPSMLQETLASQREALASAAGIAGGPPESDTSEALDPVFAPHARDWAWLVGTWSVRHRRLRERLAGCNEWDDFSGVCTNWSVMGGRGNVDDNILELPAGRYRAVTVRTFDGQAGQWSIWWIDSRASDIEPPVRGGFTEGVGIFLGDDTFKGQTIKVRFRWSEITSSSAHWDQAFSRDGGVTWETNWHMDFHRTA